MHLLIHSNRNGEGGGGCGGGGGKATVKEKLVMAYHPSWYRSMFHGPWRGDTAMAWAAVRRLIAHVATLPTPSPTTGDVCTLASVRYKGEAYVSRTRCPKM